MYAPLPQSIPDEFWWLSTVLAGVAAVWLFITKVAYPRWASYQERAQESDEKRETTALDQVIKLNTDLSRVVEKLTDRQAEEYIDKLAKLERDTGRMVELLTRIDTRSQVSTREWESVDKGMKSIKVLLEELNELMRKKSV